MTKQIASDFALYMSSTLATYWGDTITVALQLSDDSLTYTEGWPVDTTTQYGSATTYTACVQLMDPAKTDYSQLEAMGIKERDLITIWLRTTASVDDNAKVTYNGETYYVKYVSPAQASYIRAIAAKTSGQVAHG